MKKEKSKLRKQLNEQFPDIPDCVFDIEESPEMAAMYYEEID